VLCAALSVTSFTSLSVTEVSAETLLQPDQLITASTQDILADMGMGWNLGNSLDATGNGNSLDSEISWSNPKTTQALISKAKELGFNTVRVPVSWANHTTGSDYTIDPAWLNRVQEVVDYCYNEDMYVIINIHHDNQDSLSSSKRGFAPSSTYYDESEKFVDSIWAQVSEKFKDYDYHLVFETLNEPRLIGSAYEWWFNIDSVPSVVQDSINCINKLNQSAVDVIRASGGYNESRLIMCPGYDASVDGSINRYHKLPTDIEGNTQRIIASVHGYVPYNFAMNVGSGSTTTYTNSIKNELKGIMNSLKSNLINKGIPVVMGEFSSTDKDNTAERVKWATDYATLASEMNMPIILWDNNSFAKYKNNVIKLDSEYHGYIKRSGLTVPDNQQQVLNALFAPYKALEAQRKTSYVNVDINCTVAGLEASDYSKAGTRTAVIYNSDRSFTATCNLDLSSSFTFKDLSDGVYTVELCADNCVTKTVTITISNGVQTSPLNESINLKGDINGDGKLNASDLLLTKSHIKKVRLLTGYEFSCSDINGNDNINASDLLLMKSHIKGVSHLW
ncbi:MAG: cellulase family glycosylhydrolase, partial [Ruminococcus sp.]|nr:cellulase family glycosylhydrolase [Ruminococcus sp.]